MSHFVVLVIGENVDEQLKPYDENTQVDEYFEPDNDMKWDVKDAWKKFSDQLEGKYTEEEYLALSAKEAFGAISSFKGYSRFLRDNEIDFCDGEYGHYSTYNPKSQWDWYVTGGRWTGCIKMTDECIARLNQPDYKLTDDDPYLGRPSVFGDLPEEGTCDSALKRDIANLLEIPAYAYVINGEWHEKGSMGWFGMSSNEMEEGEWKNEKGNILSSLSDNTRITVVDCHI